jgi:hypothetical protein
LGELDSLLLFLVDLLDLGLGDSVFLLSRSNCLADSVPDISFGVCRAEALGDAFGLGGSNVGSGAAACSVGGGVTVGLTDALAAGVADAVAVGLALGVAATLTLGNAETVGAAVAAAGVLVVV